MVEENGRLIDYDVLCRAHLVSTDHIVYGYRAYLPITKKLVGLLDKTKDIVWNIKTQSIQELNKDGDRNEIK